MRILFILSLASFIWACGSKTGTSEVKSVVLEQLKSSHNNKNWYAPMKAAIEGLTAEQANWRDSSGNHSIGQLVAHLIFWNERNLIAFRGNKPPDFSGNNEETFTSFNPADWEQAVARLDSIESQLEAVFEKADDAQVKDWAPTAANIASHNAYHTGQIIYIRKHKGWWDPEKGVK